MTRKAGILLVVMFFCLVCFVAKTEAVQSVTFTWEANTETDLAGYRLYRSDVPGQYVYGKDKALSEILKPKTTATVTGAAPGYYILTAFDSDGFESGPSAELNTFSPVKPNGFKITIIVEALD